MKPKQLILDITPPPEPTLNNFVVGRNSELIAMLRAFIANVGERFIYLWGENGSGRSHLIKGAAVSALSVGRRVEYFKPDAALEGADNLLVIADDVNKLDANAQLALFNLYNRLRASGGALLASGDVAPTHLFIRDDLKTRLAAGLVYKVHALGDDEKGAALARHAYSHGIILSSEVTDYMLRHAPRDLPSLLGMVDALDKFALATKRPITVPLLRKLIDEKPE